MKLAIVSGSPKNRRGHTGTLTREFAAGVSKNPFTRIREYPVGDLTNTIAVRELLTQADYILVAFPLYNNAMPSGVMRFFEVLVPWISGAEPIIPACFFWSSPDSRKRNIPG